MIKASREQLSIRPADRPRLNALLTNPVLMGEYLIFLLTFFVAICCYALEGKKIL